MKKLLLIALFIFGCSGGGSDDPVDAPDVDNSFKFFAMTGQIQLLLDGHDNGIVATNSNGVTFMATGDGFIRPGQKCGTAVFTLSKGLSPMVPANWKPYKCLSGKAYGITAIGAKVYLLKSDTGSMYQGSQNVRIVGVNNNRNSATLDRIRANGINWFFVTPTTGNHVTIGCVQLDGRDYGYDNRGPVLLFSGNLDDISSFSPIGMMSGVTNRASIVSITKVGNKFVSGVGDWRDSMIMQYVSDSLTGPWSLKSREDYKPPMRRQHLGDRWSGAFTMQYYEINDNWYRFVSGHGGYDDKVFIEKVIRKG